MNSSSQPDVLILGAGVAGLAAAVALSSTGAKVALLDRKPYVGGRAYSYLHPALDEVIDSQHVLLGCCTNLIDLCNLSGASRHIRWYDNITFLEPGSPARASIIGPSFLPAPSHSTLSFLRASMLSLADKSRIALGLLQFLRGYHQSDDEPFSAWLARTRQTPHAIRHFWEPIILGALNDSFDRCATRYAAQVFYESFLKSAEGGRLGIPTQPMSEFYAPVAQLAQQQGTALHLRTSIDKIERTSNGWQATASDGSVHTAPQLLLALPFEQTASLLRTLLNPSTSVAALLSSLDRFTHAPITTLHLWFDREITPLDHAALLDTRIQWVFNKTRIRREDPSTGNQPGQYLELVISASFAELHTTREDLLASAIKELASFFPAVHEAKLLKSAILKEARATFSVTPGLDRFRPTPALGNGLFLAGDWIRTGWPSTMEGAVRSGRLAAQAISAAAGNQAVFLAPDLPPTGLMRLLSK